MKFTPIQEFTGAIVAKRDYQGMPCRVVGIDEDGEFVVLVSTDEGDLYATTAYLVRPDCEEPKCCAECGANV